jgi:hypothetical protein
MSRHSLAFWLAATVGSAVATMALFASAAEPASPEARLRAQLATGDFTLALGVARKAPTQAEHDRLLAQIADLQARSGSREAAQRTAREIYESRARGQALTRLASRRPGREGGATQADFDSLIELITSTVKPSSWDKVGGTGSIAPFPTGILADAQAALNRPLVRATPDLGDLYRVSAPRAPAQSPHRAADLRKVSLVRLERLLAEGLAAGRPADDAMQALAGLHRVQYVLVYPESGDLVVAGPAGDWKVDEQGCPRSVDTGEPVLRLDDLVVLLRHAFESRESRFGCAITPRQDALARVQSLLAASAKQSLQPGQRKMWLEQLRSELGPQDVEVYGLDPRTRTARALVEADYHMKLIGMGLAEGVAGVESYLNLIKVPVGQSPPPLDVLRWWFTMDYEPIATTGDGRAFAIRGQGVRVLSENERLAAGGQRIHTGQSEIWNSQFAASFTEHFDDLAHRYACYTELRNIFDLALATALIREHDLAASVRWSRGCFAGDGAYRVATAEPITQVDSVVNHRVINHVHVVAGVSGGVRVDPRGLVARTAMRSEKRGAASTPAPPPIPADVWWWD